MKIAAVVTVWSKNSHADVIVGKFLRGFPTDDGVVAPSGKVVSLYMDQVGPLDSASANFSALDDLGTQLAEKYGVRLCGSIAEALCLGGSEVAVDGILAIGEHGDYPVNSKGQRLYPRRHFWEQITGVLSTSERRSQIPIFTDKHLAVTWEDARWIYDTGKELGLVHMAGSSVPHCFWRDPWLEHPVDSNIEAAVMLSYGDLEAYGYHGLEALEAMIERRPGGEAGVKAIQTLVGDNIWAAAAEGRWSLPLAQHALGLVDTGDEPAADAAATASGDAAVAAVRAACGSDAALFLLEYNDGFRAALLHGQGQGSIIGGWAYAAQVDGSVVGTAFNGTCSTWRLECFCATPTRYCLDPTQLRQIGICARVVQLSRNHGLHAGNEAPNYPPFSYLARNIGAC